MRLRYEFRLLILLSATNGVVALERLSASFLSPYLVADLGLTNTQLGLLAAALSGAVAVSATIFGRVADLSGRLKTILLATTIIFSLVAGIPALVGGFTGLFLARLLLGLAEGPVIPLSQTMMAQVSHPSRRGMNMGILQMVGAFLLGGTLGPIIATMIADAYGWRIAFTASVIPGLLMAVAIWLVVKPDKDTNADRCSIQSEGERLRAPAQSRGSLLSLLKVHNIRLCVMISGLFAAWVTIQSVFLPVYLTEVRGLAPTTMGWIIGAGGLAGLIGGLAIPTISDFLGRRPVMVICSFAGVVAPIALLTLPTAPIQLGIAVLIGWMVMGISPLYIAVIPSESAPVGMIASAIGLSTAAGELVGGVFGPSVAGGLADAFGLEAPLLVCVGLAVACGLLCLLLKESGQPGLIDDETLAASKDH